MKREKVRGKLASWGERKGEESSSIKEEEWSQIKPKCRREYFVLAYLKGREKKERGKKKEISYRKEKEIK